MDIEIKKSKFKKSSYTNFIWSLFIDGKILNEGIIYEAYRINFNDESNVKNIKTLYVLDIKNKSRQYYENFKLAQYDFIQQVLQILESKSDESSI